MDDVKKLSFGSLQSQRLILEDTKPILKIERMTMTMQKRHCHQNWRMNLQPVPRRMVRKEWYLPILSVRHDAFCE